VRSELDLERDLAAEKRRIEERADRPRAPGKESSA